MPADSRPRRLATAALTVALALLSGCVQNPNSVFHSRTDFNRDVGGLFELLIWLGTAVFVFTEAMLVVAMWKYRSRPGKPRRPEQVHGNTKLEILWTIIPAVVLAVIAVPTVRTIFKTQAPVGADALQVEVIGHQWWWEFKYPQYNIATANEVYLPIGRTVNFALKTHDVLHSFWVPALGGKRDLVNNRTNYIWFTPDSTTESAFNGFCAEYCGVSHANMRFRAFTVTPEQFESWVQHQRQPAVFRATPAAEAAAPLQAGFIGFARERMPDHTVPRTPIPAAVRFDTTIVGDAGRGELLVTRGTCAACHAIGGIPTMIGSTGPNLTHVGSRLTIAGGLFPNDKLHLGSWIKNARLMKPGVFMNTFGIGQYDPIVKSRVTVGLTEQQIADIVAYLQALK